MEPSKPGAATIVMPQPPNMPSGGTLSAGNGQIASGILNGMQKASTPLDFVTKNLRAPEAKATPTDAAASMMQPQQSANPQVVTRPESMKPATSPVIDRMMQKTAPKAEPQIPTTPVDTSTFVDPFTVKDQAVLPPPVEAFVEDTNLDEPFAEEHIEEVDESQLTPEQLAEREKQKSKAASISTLRKNLGETKRELQGVQTELESAREEIRKFHSGETVPAELLEARERIESLEHFEQLHAYKLSPEYQRNFAGPLEQLKHQARELAEKYEVDPALLDQALAKTKQQDRNKFLNQVFKGDSVAALEAREILDDYEDLSVQAYNSEQKPREELSRLQTDARINFEKEAEARVDRIRTVARNVWKESLSGFNGNDTFPELSFRPNDDKHNAVVRPIHERAARDFGFLSTEMAKSGVVDLPPTVMKLLADNFLLAQASRSAIESRNQYFRQNQELLANSRTRTAVTRPQVGSHAVSNGHAAPRTPQSPREAAGQLIRGQIK